MIRKILLLLLLLPAFAVTAQTEPPIIHDFYESCKGLINTFKYNDEISIMQVKLSNEDFDILAVDEQMKVLWKTNLKGYALSSGKLKNKVIAIATTDFSKIKGLGGATNNEYKGFVIDPLTGKVELEKIIYNGGEEKVERPALFFNEEGTFFKMTVLKTALGNRLHVPLPSLLAYITLAKMEKKEHTMTGFLAMDLDTDLNVTQLIDPKIPDGSVLNYGFNSKGDLFLLHGADGPSIQLLRYSMAHNEPVSSAPVNFPVYKKADINDLSRQLTFTISQRNNDIAYVGTIHKNADKDLQLSVIKVNVSSGANLLSSTVLSRDHLKQLEKNFEPFNKKMKKPDFGNPIYLVLEHVKEAGDKLAVGLSNHVLVSSQRGSYYVGTSSMVNIYDADMKLINEQAIPAHYANERRISSSFNVHKNKLYVMSTDTKGPEKVNCLYGVIDLHSGKLETMEWLVNKKVDRDDRVSGQYTMWFKNNCIVPYESPKGFMIRSNTEITLLQKAL